MKFTFLGTGAGLPSKNRNVSAVALSLLQELNSVWLFDCGEATQHQILYTAIRPRKISKIFITHLHGDHIYGLPGLLGSRSFQGGDTPLTVYGPVGIKPFIETSLEISKTRLSYPLEIHEFDEEGLLFDEADFQVSVKKLEHGIPSYGFRITEKDRPGELLVHKLQEKGIRPGPIYQEIKANETVTLPDGQILFRKDFLGPDKPGRIISVLGDTRNPLQSADFVRGSDLLIHEATYEAGKEELAHDYFHSTTAQAAALAQKAEVKQLILTHISSRYQEEDEERLLNEARAIFPNTEMARDLSVFHLPAK